MTNIIPEENELKELLKSSMIKEPGKETNRQILNRIAKYQTQKKAEADIPWVGIIVMVILVLAMVYFLSVSSFEEWNYLEFLSRNFTQYQLNLSPVFTLSIGALAVASWGLILINKVRKGEIPL